jgi:C-terminal processing protease CtpA/Prc
MNTNKTISRTKATEIITGSKGKFFTVTFTKNNSKPRTINGNYKKGNTTKLGYLTVYSMTDKGYRSVNPKTISSLSWNGTTYRVK